MKKGKATRRTIEFFPFYLLGVYSTTTTIEKIRNKPHYLSIIFIVICLLFLLIPDIKNLSDFHKILWRSLSFVSISPDIVKVFWVNLLTLGLAIILCFSFINIIPDSKFANENGKDTMFFYIYHAIIIKFLNPVFALLLIPVDSSGVLLLISFLIIWALVFAKKNKYLRSALKPYSSIKGYFLS